MAKIGLKLDIGYLKPEAPPEEILAWQSSVADADRMLNKGTGPGAEFRGWLHPGELAPPALLSDISKTARSLQDNSDALVVIGIGGSYLGARAVIEALATDDARPVFFAGINISADYHQRMMKKLEGKRVALNVISKSGTTTEPAVAFRLFQQWVIQKSGKDAASKLIVATTDAKKGALVKLAQDSGYKTFVVPDDVGGRYSVLSPVGLLPIAYAGINIEELVNGASDCSILCDNTDINTNPAYAYAAARNTLYGKGFNVEVFSHFEPRLHYVAEWWKQLYGESEGKDHKALFPASVEFTADLHSMGQYIQEGRRFLIETLVTIESGEPGLAIPVVPGSEDGLNYLEGRPLTEVNHEAYRATSLAHWEGGVPNMTIKLERLDARHLGALLYFYERACAISGYLGRVNPFDQPGVEAYKNHMFALLGKPGFEDKTKEIRHKVEQVAGQQEISFG